MSRTTPLLLALVVAVLGYVTWQQLRREDRQKKDEEVALFEGVDPAQVKRFLIENLERGQHLAFERDGRGQWQMVEPMRIPANQALVQHLFEILLDRRGTPVPAPVGSAAAKPEDLHLDPPRAILEMEVNLGGSPHRSRVDLGSVDIDGAHVHVQANGRLLRTWRDIDTMLDRGLEEYMSHDILELSSTEVVELHRRGSLVREKGMTPSDLTLDALLENGTWRSTAPVTGLLDPQTAGLYVQGLTALRGTGFADFGRRLLADFGLDPPEMRITVATVSARTVALRFGRPGHAAGRPWHCLVEGEPTVWFVDSAPVEFFDSAVEILMDASLTRLPVQEVDGLSLSFEGRELRLWHEKAGGLPGGVWKASERPGPEAAFTQGLVADRRRIEDLLGRISHVQIASFLHGEILAPAEIRGSLVVQAGSDRQGGSLGAEVGSAEKGRAVRYQRTGDSIAGLVDPEILDFMRTPMQDLLSLLVVDLPEIEQTGLEISGAGVKKRYVHGSRGLWTPPDVPFEARELRDVLDTLTILRATKHLGGGPLPPLVDPIEVDLRSMTGTTTKYSIGLVPDAPEGERVQVDREGRRSVLKDQGLHQRLLAVLKKH